MKSQACIFSSTQKDSQRVGDPPTQHQFVQGGPN